MSTVIFKKDLTAGNPYIEELELAIQELNKVNALLEEGETTHV